MLDEPLLCKNRDNKVGHCVWVWADYDSILSDKQLDNEMEIGCFIIKNKYSTSIWPSCSAQ